MLGSKTRIDFVRQKACIWLAGAYILRLGNFSARSSMDRASVYGTEAESSEPTKPQELSNADNAARSACAAPGSKSDPGTPDSDPANKDSGNLQAMAEQFAKLSPEDRAELVRLLQVPSPSNLFPDDMQAEKV